MLVFLSSSVVVSVATTAATTFTITDYPDNDRATLPPATTGRPVRTQATQGSPRVRGAWLGPRRGGPWGAWGAHGRGRRGQ